MLPTVLLNCTRKNPVVGRSQRCSRLLPLGSHQTCAGWQSSIRVLFPGLSEVSFAGRSSGGGKNPFYAKKTACCLVVDGGTVMGSLFASANRVLVLIEKGKKITKQPRKKTKTHQKNFQFMCCGAACRFPPTHGSCSLGLPLALFLLQRTQWYGCPPLGRMAFTAKIS